jgi:hypothetical protein
MQDTKQLIADAKAKISTLSPEEQQTMLEELRDLLRDTNAMSKEYLQELKALEERANTSTE